MKVDLTPDEAASLLTCPVCGLRAHSHTDLSRDVSGACAFNVMESREAAVAKIVEDRLTQMLERVQAPLNSAKELTDPAMGQGKDKDDCTPGEILARGVWHGLHYVERYLTGWEEPGGAEWFEQWEETTDRFRKMALEAAEADPKCEHGIGLTDLCMFADHIANTEEST